MAVTVDSRKTPAPDGRAAAVPDVRRADEVLGWSRGLLDLPLRQAVATLAPPMRRVAGYHFGWWDERERPIEADGGKALRPALVLLAAEAAGGQAGDAVPAAVAVELVHNFSLVHDDVIDGDTTRRHRPTAWSAFGRTAAILAGDALLSLAFTAVTRGGRAGEGVRVLGACVQSLLDGQSADVDFELRTDVGLAECLRMAEGKTGALMGCACALGALYGGATSGRAANLAAFGERLGLAFQVVDDLLGIWGDPAVTGKPVHSDLRSRKKSLPVVAALTSGTPAGAELAELYHQEPPLSPCDLTRAAELVEEAGGREWSVAAVDDLLAEALDRLRAAEPEPRAAAELEALARLAADRDH
ncbi:family 2 encapsulin nanocompartment cargo protein polyprenyl transferase [Microbispora corallina]|uniref:family 2 encapsulin nanocompartment cargo protein polyprenyl transferase n=1 Tax=Microbispora corallina TaxID=83302 RepID=UPI001950A3D8|nr:family 2 encapsulin nanocompartment cargo protein polyprenyl transferase [Microbispora corallina]